MRQPFRLKRLLGARRVDMADLSKVMEREQLCSEHAAQCFLEAGRRERAAAKRCPHGVLLPHECRECEAEATPEEIAAFMAAEGLAPNDQASGARSVPLDALVGLEEK